MQSGVIKEDLTVVYGILDSVFDSGQEHRSTVFSWYPVCPSK
jgi:hypothetical protein